MPAKASTSPVTITYRTSPSTLQADIYVPASPTGAVCLIAHVGGFTSLSATKADTACVDLAHALNTLGIIAVSYDYTPATGAGTANGQFPRAIWDTLQLARWVRWNIAAYGGDPARMGAVGLSAGGNLVAMAALATLNSAYTLTNGTSLVEPNAQFGQLPNEAKLFKAWGWWYGIGDMRSYSTISPGNANPTNVLTYLNVPSSADVNYAPRAADASPITLLLAYPNSALTQPFWMAHGSADVVSAPAQSTTMDATRTTIATGSGHLFDPTSGGANLSADLTMFGAGSGSLLGYL